MSKDAVYKQTERAKNKAHGYRRMPERWIREAWIPYIDALIEGLRKEEDDATRKQMKDRFK